MHILPISKNYHTNFRANNRWVRNKEGKELYKTTTYYFRDDLDWENLIQYICKKYKDVPKVNFINHACSNGLESLSFLMALFVYAPECVKKFTPILAKDIDEQNIIFAKQGYCGASSDDFLRIDKLTKGCYKHFLNLKYDETSQDLFIMSPKNILKDNIIFEQGDIFEDIEKMPRENTFLCCRNFWMYLSPKKQEILAARLGRHFSSGSSVLLGYLDTVNASAHRFLEVHGFKRCPVGTEYVNIMYSKV